ncbi:MAG: type II toxin-antitoxin system RelE/ParE family toxin [Desulfobacterales bacterium]|nr:type II toxin-antitoxin system RelE/ParE family toxin [Desulfobacterales bacterium]
MKAIFWKSKALRQLRKIGDRNVRQEIFKAVDTLKCFPVCPNVKKVKNTELFRLRVGRWRVLFTEALEIVTVEEVKKRDERTYK